MKITLTGGWEPIEVIGYMRDTSGYPLSLVPAPFGCCIPEVEADGDFTEYGSSNWTQPS